MSVKPQGTGSRFASALVAVAMLCAAFAVLIPVSAASTAGAAPTAAASCGQVPVPLGSASTYAALSGTSVTNTGATALTGDLGVSPGSAVTGFPPGTYTGTKNVANPAAASAEANVTTAYNNASSRSNCAITVAGNLGGQTLTPGLYKSTSSLAVSSGDLTLSGGGNPNGVFVFQVASALTTTSGRAVVLSNGAQAGNVFWVVGSSVTIGTTSTVQGTILAYASISMLTGSHLNGRALARTGDVTLAATTIVVPTTSAATTYPVTFTESGLSAGTSWSVTVSGVQQSSTTTSLQFTLASGSYPYVVNAVTGFVAAPASGTLTVSGAATAQSIAFTPGTSSSYPVTFTAAGAISGTSWSVTLNGVPKTTSGTTVEFTEPDGTYAFSVGGATGYTATPSAGSVTVAGSAATQSIAFSSTSGAATFAVTFTESGLVAGTNWSMTVSGVTETSATTTLVFTEINGSNAYSVATTSGYTVSPSSGNVMVSGSTAGPAITFTSTGGGGGGGGSSAGTPTWEWVALGLVVIGAIVAIGAGIVIARRK